MSPLSLSTRQKLKTVSTATIATCLYKKGLRNQFIQNVKWSRNFLELMNRLQF